MLFFLVENALDGERAISFNSFFYQLHALLPASTQARTQGGMQGMHSPTRPKEVLTWHLISLKIIDKNIFVLRITCSRC